MAGQSKNIKEGPWLFTIYSFSPKVMVAERKIKWYDDARLNEIRERMKDGGCKFFWNETATNGSGKHHTTVEVYQVTEKDIPFKDRIEMLQPLLEMVK